MGKFFSTRKSIAIDYPFNFYESDMIKEVNVNLKMIVHYFAAYQKPASFLEGW